MPSKRKPGAGLSHLIQQEPAPPDEPPTTKLPIIPEVHAGEAVCALCGGAGELHTTPYALTTCPECNGKGTVSRDAFDRFVTEHPHCLAARQLKRQKT